LTDQQKAEEQKAILYYLKRSPKDSLKKEAADLIESQADRIKELESYLSSIGAGGVSKMQ